MNISTKNYDPQKWGVRVHSYKSIEVALTHDLARDGIHQILLDSSQSLDIFCKNFAKKSDPRGGFFLVCFNAAVSNRETTFTPFFSGLSISESVELPIVAVSDPTLLCDDTIGLSWYAGNEACVDLQHQIATIIDQMSKSTGLTPIMFGGSGGGFAALATAKLLSTPHYVAVWNPQTSISSYIPEHVLKYLQVGFPKLLSRNANILDVSKPATKDDLYRILDSSPIIHDITKSVFPDHSSIIILQNRDDWHVEKHLGPLMETHVGWHRVGDSSFVKGQNIGVHIGDFGKGHSAPSKPVLEYLFRSVVERQTVKQIVASFSSGIEHIQYKKPAAILFHSIDVIAPKLTAKLTQNSIEVSCGLSENLAKSYSFAFYLLRSGSRIDSRWYSKSKNHTFAKPANSNGLSVVAFLKDQFNVVKRYSVPVRNVMGSSLQTLDLASDTSANIKSYEQWEYPVFKSPNVDSAIAFGFEKDGIYRIELNNNQSVEICINNAEMLKSATMALVGFSAAITNRELKKGPFFSGLSVTADLAVPSIFISDPTVDLNEKIGLAWYAGNENALDLGVVITKILNAIADKNSLRLMLFGGSGAGFAALNTMSHLNAETLAVIWNPQTSISEYSANFVRQYLQNAFPKIYAHHMAQLSTGEKKETIFRNIMDEAGIQHSVLDLEASSQHRVIYLQNRHDWHIEKHANPFLRKQGPWTPLTAATYLNESKTILVVFGDWGAGHAGPPRDLVQFLLHFGVHNEFSSTFLNESSAIHKRFEMLLPYSWELGGDAHTSVSTEQHPTWSIDLEVSTSTDAIFAKTTVITANVADDYLYAFYLKLNGERKEFRWYEKNSTAKFSLPSESGVIELVAFVKDKSGKLVIESKRLN